MKQMTLVFAIEDNFVWLAMKKRGFGSDKWNGYGGKVEENETVEQAAIREFEEESAAIITNDDLHKQGVIDFYFEEKPEYNQQVHIFIATHWNGDIQETQEMRPKKFSFSKVPYADMWKGDDLWIPKILAGESVHGKIVFSGDDDQQEVIAADF